MSSISALIRKMLSFALLASTLASCQAALHPAPEETEPATETPEPTLGESLSSEATPTLGQAATVQDSSEARPSKLASPVQSLRLEDQSVDSVILADRYVLWTGYPGDLYRYSFEDGTIDTIAVSNFANGYLDPYEATNQGDWVVFRDTPRSGQEATWKLRAVNVTDRREKLLMEESDPASWPGPFVDVDGNRVVWSLTKASATAGCVETIIQLYDLAHDSLSDIARSCVEDRYMWIFPHLSGNHLVVERDLPDSKSRGNDVFLFDLQSTEPVSLTENGKSSMPVIWYPWVAWKDGPRFSYARTTVQNLETGERFTIAGSLKGQDRLEPNMAGKWIYWMPAALQPFYVYDLEKRQMFIVAEPGENETIQPVTVFGNRVAWAKNLDFEHSGPHAWLIEWRDLPPE